MNRKRTYLIALAVIATALVAVVISSVQGWVSVQKAFSELNATYIPILERTSEVSLDISQSRTELFRYLNKYEPSPYLIRKRLKQVRANLLWISRGQIPQNSKVLVEALLDHTGQFQKMLNLLESNVNKGDSIDALLTANMLKGSSTTLSSLSGKLRDNLWDHILYENEASQERLLRNNAVLAGISLILIMILVFGVLLQNRVLQRQVQARTVELENRLHDLHQSERALQESEEKYRTVLESNPDPVVVYDMVGRVIYLNPAFTRVFGWSMEEQIGKKIDNFVPEENWPETWMMINKVTELGESFSGLETRRYTKEGNILDISISGSCYKDQEGNVAASVINLRDTTEEKRLEDQLQHAQKMEAIAILAGGVAHEFNNALMGIMGNIELLKMDLSEDERRDRYFRAMNGSSHRMSRLTDQLLAYAQGGKYQPKNLQLKDFVIETLPILQHDISPEVRVETHFPKDISYIKADYAQMQMVLSAILANSNEAIEDEGLIRITAENKDVDEDFAKQHPSLKHGHYVCLTIEDNGKGMDDETRSGIFEPFFTTKFQGRGMGMAAVYGIVKNHDGWISVDSELGKGTVVQIYLPAIEIEVEKPKKAKVEVATGSGTILMIEDEDVVIEVTQAMLERLGYRVMVAKTGKDAVHIAETFDGQIDLALLDIKLPDIDGRNLYPLIMKARSNLKVIVFSGYSIDGPAREILDAGAQDFIQKPFSLATLSEKLKEVLGENNP
jgi:PAS domain S-box-containing protein